MIIKIDNREDIKIFNTCNSILDPTKHKIIQENLPLGDIIIYDNNNEEHVIIERKTVKDLAASIKDGRYKEQSFRLDGCTQHNHNIYYLIEGNIDGFKHYTDQRINQNVLWSAIISLNYFKGFSVIKTQSLKESCDFIVCLCNKLEKENDKNPYYSNIHQELIDNNIEKENVELNSESNIGYVDVIKRSKKDNINESNILQIMLCTIPNISNASAKAICEVYPNMKNLVFDLEKEGISCLDKIMIKTIGKDNQTKMRKLSKTCKENIKNFILGKA